MELIRYRVGEVGYRDVEEYDLKRYSGRGNEYKQRVMSAAYRGLAGNVRGLKVLDVGCGTGRGLVDFARAGAAVFGSDASIDMLQKAARKFAGDRRRSLAAAAAQQLPFRDAAFDLVVSLNFLHLFTLETQRHMVSEMERVVRPGGRLILEFDNALHGLVVGPWKRWRGVEQGSLPHEIRHVIGDRCPVLSRRGAVYPVVWRLFSFWPSLFEPIERLAWLPGLNLLAHRVYYEIGKPDPSGHAS